MIFKRDTIKNLRRIMISEISLTLPSSKKEYTVYDTIYETQISRWCQTDRCCLRIE